MSCASDQSKLDTDCGSRPPQESSHRWELNAHGYSMIGSFCAPQSRRARARRSQRAAGRKTALRNAALAAANPKILLLEFLLGDDPFIFMEQNALTTRSRMLLKGDEGGAKFGGGARGGDVSAGRGARGGLAGANGVLAITLTSGRLTGLSSSANTASDATSAAKLTALSKPREMTRGRQTVARPALSTPPRIPNAEVSARPLLFSDISPHLSRYVSSRPHENSGLTPETHKAEVRSPIFFIMRSARIRPILRDDRPHWIKKQQSERDGG
jgi:hypothetical protein